MDEISIYIEERRGIGNKIDSPHFELKSLRRMIDFFPSSVLLKVQKSGDTTLITPWVNLVHDLSIIFSNNKRATFESEKLGIPIIEAGNKVLIFFVCGGLDEYDNIPDWVSQYTPEDLQIAVAPETYEETKGHGVISICKQNDDWTYIVKNQNINDGDFIRVRSNYYEVLGIVEDAFQPNFDCVRFCQDFENNANNAAYGIVKPPLFCGNFAWMSKQAIELYRPVTMQIIKTDSDGYGQLHIQFQNACFNKLGFLTHDTAI